MAGFTASQANVAVQIDDIAADAVYTVYYSGSLNTGYQIVHQYQNLAGDFVTDGSLTENLSGTTGDWVTATAVNRAGFTAPSSLPGAYIAADGSTVLQVRYTPQQLHPLLRHQRVLYPAPGPQVRGSNHSADTREARLYLPGLEHQRERHRHRLCSRHFVRDARCGRHALCPVAGGHR